MGLKNNFCIRVTQENSIESSLQSHLPYIPKLMVYAHYYATYSKWLCVRNEVNICCICCMISLLQNLLCSFLVSWPVTMTAWPIITLTLTLDSKNWKLKNKKENKEKLSLPFLYLTDGEVQNIPGIQIAALHCILLSSISEYNKDTFL